MAPSTRPLDHDDPRVQAARSAERDAYRHYGFEPEEHYGEIPNLNLQIRVVEVGTGPPLVLICGGPGPGAPFIPLLPELQDYATYVMDRPGGGLSDGIDYRSLPLWQLAASSTVGLFDHFKLDEAPVIGNSMGGLWALRFALEYPERVTAIVLLGCPALYPGTSAPFFPMRLGSIPGLSGWIVENLMQSDGPTAARDALTHMGHPSETAERLPDEFAEMGYRMENLPHFKETWASLLQTGLTLWGADSDAAFTPGDLRNVSAPVCLLWGSNDPFGSVETGRAGAKHFPDADFHEVGTGHLPWLDAPEQCGEIIRDFLDRHG